MENQNLSSQFLPLETLDSLAYYEFAADNVYPLQSLPYSAIYFVDQGAIVIERSNETFLLEQGTCLFIEKQTPRIIKTLANQSATMFLVGFSMRTELHSEFSNQKMLLTKHLRQLLGTIFKLSESIYPEMDTRIYQVNKRLYSVNPLDEWLLYVYLSELILLLLQETTLEQKMELTPATPPLRRQYTHKLTNEVITYMEQTLSKNMSIDSFASQFFVSPSYLKKIFKMDTGYSIINYFRTLKIEEAKRLIRENQVSLTTISNMLGYDSIHHFSNSFKRATGFSPSSYRKSIQSIEEKLDLLL